MQCSRDRSFRLAVRVERILEISKRHAGRNGGGKRKRERESGDIYVRECTRVSRARLTLNRISVISKCFLVFGSRKKLQQKMSQVPVFVTRV